MDESRSPGITSCLPVNSVDEALARLKILANSAAVKKILKALGTDSQLIIVGGSVREAFFEQTEADLDLATVLEPDVVHQRLESAGISIYETGLQHGTVTAVISKQNIEITTFRKSDGKGSTVFSKTLTEDLKARDFTINAIAFDISRLSIVDPLAGIEDLEKGILRSCGDAAARFDEDPLRVLRMLRFGPAAGRTIEEATYSAARSRLQALSDVSVERIRLELEKILMSKCPARGLRAMAEMGALAFVLPELQESVGFEQNRFHYEDVFEHTLTVIENTPPDLKLRLAALFHDIGKPQSLTVGDDGNRHFYQHEEIGARICRKAMRRLRFSNKQIDDICLLVKMHMRPLDCGPAGVRRLMRDLGELFEDWKQLKQADFPPVMEKQEFQAKYQAFDDLVQSEVERLEKTRQKVLAVDGNDLIALGEKPGKKLGNILKYLENLVIENPELNEKQVLLEKAQLIINGNLDIGQPE